MLCVYRISTNSFWALRLAVRKHHGIVCRPATETDSFPFPRNNRCCMSLGQYRRWGRTMLGTLVGSP